MTVSHLSKVQGLVDKAWPHIAKVVDDVNKASLKETAKRFLEVRDVPASTCLLWRDVTRHPDGDDWTYSGTPLPMRHLHKSRDLDEDALRVIERDGGRATVLATVRGFLDAAMDKAAAWVLDELKSEQQHSGGATAASVGTAVDRVSQACGLDNPQCVMILTANRHLDATTELAIRRALNGGDIVRTRVRCRDQAIAIVLPAGGRDVVLHQAMPMSVSWHPRSNGDGIMLTVDERLAVHVVQEKAIVRIVP